MRKPDLVAAVESIAELSPRVADEAVASAFEHITNALSRGEGVSLVGFGSFSVKTSAARVGRNPKTNEPIEIAESQRVVFKAGAGLKGEVNGG